MEWKQTILNNGNIINNIDIKGVVISNDNDVNDNMVIEYNNDKDINIRININIDIGDNRIYQY